MGHSSSSTDTIKSIELANKKKTNIFKNKKKTIKFSMPNLGFDLCFYERVLLLEE